MTAQRIKFISIFGLALLLSVASYELIQKYVAEQTSKEIKEHQEQYIDVLVSRKSIVAGDIIESVVLAKRSYPQTLVQDSWLRPEDAELIIGLAAARFIEKGEPLSPDTLVPVAAKTFSQSLKDGDVAVTTMISKPQLHSGLLQIGDQVTLVSASFDVQEDYLVLNNIEVLALDDYNQPNQLALSNQDYLPSTITFAFSTEQALVFEQMRRQGFAVWLQSPQTTLVPISRPKSIAIYYMQADREVDNAINF
jgi:Flp pilus assembly protein CpaB